MHILEKVAPGLVEQLKRQPLPAQRRVVAKACEAAAHAIRELNPGLRSAVDACARDSQISQAEIESINKFAEEADERYLLLQQSGQDEIVWQNWFYQARLATAIGAAFGATSWEGSADAIYEITAIFADPSEIIGLVKAEIQRSFGA